MICIQKKNLKIKSLDNIKKIVKHHKSLVSNHLLPTAQSYPLDDNFIRASIGMEKDIIIPSSLLNSIGYCYDVTRKLMIFKDQDSLKKFLNNRIKSLKLNS